MCGISGWLAPAGLAREAAKARAEVMTGPILTRGPDGHGAYVSQDGQLGLIHTRLAIIDPDPRSSQPMADPASGVAIVFNGEIYNYRGLRQALLADGVRLVTEGDTEVIMQGYIRHGTAYFARLRGMFAFAIHDPRDGTLVAMRDPVGIKPLYVTADEAGVVFSSSPTAVAAAKGAPELEPAAAVSLAVLGCVIDPLSKWRGVSPLAPGVAHRWTIKGGRLQLHREAIEPAFAWGDDKSPNGLLAAVKDTISAHFTADVPVAIFQSAGLDSTLFSTAAKALGLNPTLLTIGFDEFRNTPMDEVAGAAQTARRLGLEHRVSYIRREEFMAFEADFLRAMESPTADGINTALVSRFARTEGFKVALSGVGGDELFAGYPSFSQLPKLARLAPIGRDSVLRGLADLALKIAPLDRRRSPKMRYLARYLASIGDSYLFRRSYFAMEELPMVLDPDVIRRGLAAFQAAYQANVAAMTEYDQATVRNLEWNVYMRNVLLKDADWTGMANGVEIRVPFVDVPFQRAVCDRNNRCPYAKEDLRRLIEVLDPGREMAPRPKSGFFVPHEAWLLGAKAEDANLLKFGSAGPRAWNRRVLAAQFGDWALPPHQPAA